MLWDCFTSTIQYELVDLLVTQDNNKIDTLRFNRYKKIDNSNQNVEWEGEVWLLPDSQKKGREKFGFRQIQRLEERIQTLFSLLIIIIYFLTYIL